MAHAHSVTLKGWVKHYRLQRKRLFVDFTDGSCLAHLQLIFERPTEGPEDEIFTSIQCRMALKVTGELKASPGVGQTWEMAPTSWEILGRVADDYPIPQKQELSLDYLRGLPSLRAHTELFRAIRRIRSRAYHALAEYYGEHGFLCLDQPTITESACEGGCDPLQVTSLLEGKEGAKTIAYDQDFFGKPVYLTVSAQLHLECDALAVGRAYCWTRAFRGEKSQTTKHVAEFTMLEHEACFPSLDRNIMFTVEAIRHAARAVLEECGDDVDYLEQQQRAGLRASVEHLASGGFFAVTSHQECVERMLADVAAGTASFVKLPAYDEDLSSEHERYIVDVIHKGMPVVVRYFPEGVKAFYMPLMPDGKHVDCFDILLPRVGEVVGGSQRETDYERLMSRVKAQGLDPEPLQFYLDLRKYGTIPHGGMGLGFDRLVMYLTGTDNIRDVSSFPRAYKLCKH